jgi:hypothetical protein
MPKGGGERAKSELRDQRPECRTGRRTKDKVERTKQRERTNGKAGERTTGQRSVLLLCPCRPWPAGRKRGSGRSGDVRCQRLEARMQSRAKDKVVRTKQRERTKGRGRSQKSETRMQNWQAIRSCYFVLGTCFVLWTCDFVLAVLGPRGGIRSASPDLHHSHFTIHSCRSWRKRGGGFGNQVSVTLCPCVTWFGPECGTVGSDAGAGAGMWIVSRFPHNWDSRRYLRHVSMHTTTPMIRSPRLTQRYCKLARAPDRDQSKRLRAACDFSHLCSLSHTSSRFSHASRLANSSGDLQCAFWSCRYPMSHAWLSITAGSFVSWIDFHPRLMRRSNMSRLPNTRHPSPPNTAERTPMILSGSSCNTNSIVPNTFEIDYLLLCVKGGDSGM